MSDRDFDAQRALTREFREALDAFAEDARRLVQDEVDRGRPDPEEWAALARRAAADEIRGVEPPPEGVLADGLCRRGCGGGGRGSRVVGGACRRGSPGGGWC